MSAMKSEGLVSAARNVRQRVAQALSAQVALRVVVIGQQVLLTPLFLSRWGAEGYATWIAASAVASLATLASAGVGQATSAEIAFKLRNDDRDGLAALFSNAVAILVGLGLLWTALTGLLLIGANLQGLDLAGGEAKVILILNVVVLLSFLGSPWTGLLGAIRGAGIPSAVMVAFKAAETVACGMLLAIANVSQVVIACIMLFSAVATFLTLVLMARRQCPWLAFRVSAVRWQTASSLIVPSVNNFLVFISVNIISVQLPRIFIPWALNLVALSSFAAMSTYFRTIRSFCAVAPMAVQTEVSLAHGGGEKERLKRIGVMTVTSMLWLSILGAVGALIVGPFVFPLWTANVIPFDWRLGALLAAGVACSTAFDAYLAILLAVNSLGRLPIIYLACTIAATVAGFFLAGPFGLNAYAAALIAPELVGIALAMRQLKRVSGIDVPLRDVLLNPPWREAVAVLRYRKATAPVANNGS